MSRPQPGPPQGRPAAGALIGLSMLALAGCAAPVEAPPEAAVEAAAAPVSRPRQGPWRVVCYKDDEIVFEHDRIYRVWQANDRPPQWAYETEEGVPFRGRLGAQMNCSWERQSAGAAAPDEPPPAPDERPAEPPAAPDAETALELDGGARQAPR